MKRKAIKIGIIITIILVTIFAWVKISHFFKVNECLDKGGRWNYETNECEDIYKINSENLSNFYWVTEYDSLTNKEFLVKGNLLDSIGQSPNDLILILNKRKSDAKVQFVNITNDTLKIKIINDEILTERMGSTGAECFLAETVFTLTENEKIKFINIEMEYGSHAGPGIYNRQSFDEFIRK